MSHWFIHCGREHSRQFEEQLHIQSAPNSESNTLITCLNGAPATEREITLLSVMKMALCRDHKHPVSSNVFTSAITRIHVTLVFDLLPTNTK